ncbi:hypothetical protein GF343_02640 [Candidatus Woesearchaeota archaeon]|nr:hypothetical protein [Candidatus Woesearchaeota archaeon]
MKQRHLEKMEQLSDYVQNTAKIFPFLMGTAVYALGMFTGISIDAVTQKIQEDMTRETVTNKQQVGGQASAEKTVKKIEEILSKNYHSQDSINEEEVQRDYYLFQGRAEEYITQAIDYYEQVSPVLTDERKKKFFADIDNNGDMVISELEAKLALEKNRQDVKDARAYIK